MDKPSRLVVDIPDELHQRIRVAAVMDRRHIRELVTECLNRCYPAAGQVREDPADTTP